jgi:hypothetical protein
MVITPRMPMRWVRFKMACRAFVRVWKRTEDVPMQAGDTVNINLQYQFTKE